MSSAPDSREMLCIARQPILDRRGRVFGYELLYRAHEGATVAASRGDEASSRVFSDAILSFGLVEIAGTRPAFVNFTRELLLTGAATLTSPASLVIEILEDMVIDREVVEMCRDLHRRGFAIALDDYVPDPQFDSLLPYVTFIKIDMLLTAPAELVTLAGRFHPLGIRLIAEKVETVAMADLARAHGFELVQGYFFCKPTTMSTTALPAGHLASIQLLSVLSREDVAVQQIEDLIKHDPSITFKVLRSVNSAASGVRREITSIQQALVLLGRDQVRRWAAVWTLSGLNTTGTQETVTLALLRARCCELLGDRLGGTGGGDGFFLLGLCSLLDAIVGRPMATAIADLPLPGAIRSALLGGQNRARTALDAIIAYERGDWEGAATELARLGRPIEDLQEAYTDALRWTRELSAVG